MTCSEEAIVVRSKRVAHSWKAWLSIIKGPPKKIKKINEKERRWIKEKGLVCFNEIIIGVKGNGKQMFFGS